MLLENPVLLEKFITQIAKIYIGVVALCLYRVKIVGNSGSIIGGTL